MRLVLAASLGFVLTASLWGQHAVSAGHSGGSIGIGRPGGGAIPNPGFSARPVSPTPRVPHSSGSTSVYRSDSLPRQNHYQYSSPTGAAPFGGAYPYGERADHAQRGRGDGHRPYYYSGGVYSGVYLTPSWLDSGFDGYGADPGGQGQQEGYASPAPVADAGASYSSPSEAEIPQSYQSSPARPPYQPDASSQAAELRDQPQLTLLFKDGRPPQQVQNYAVTRSTLYVLDGVRRREIPLNQLDVPLTEKTNREAGIDFDVPATAD